jgi:hypothetical protein
MFLSSNLNPLRSQKTPGEATPWLSRDPSTNPSMGQSDERRDLGGKEVSRIVLTFSGKAHTSGFTVATNNSAHTQKFQNRR